jgi:protein-S-isoprenylcysteine O-methyltransferase Ste14
MNAGIARPRSAANFALCCVAMIAGLALIGAIDNAGGSSLRGWLAYAPLLPCLGIVFVIALCERFWPSLRAPSSGALPGNALRPLDLRRVGIRLCGVAATFGLLAFAYWLFPEYGGNFYDPYWQFLRTLAPLGALIPLYLVWADRRIDEPSDEYYAMGTLIIGRWRSVDGALIRRHLLGWVIKGFFLPLMTVYLSAEVRSLSAALHAIASDHGVVSVYQVFYHLSYTVDLLFCVVGYGAAIRLFDSHIRSVEPTVAGWVVALICYQPFYSVIGRFYLQYDDAIYWDNWLLAWPAVRVAWAAVIIALTVIYALCTVSFGLRFSNLTHRGIITGGPYRFTKHPAYLAKNLSWWLISVPFVSQLGWSAALRNCVLLALLNLIYYARARTEERHLSRDPTYVAYALWMDQHGLLAGLARGLPFIRYRAPPAPPGGS